MENVDEPPSSPGRHLVFAAIISIIFLIGFYVVGMFHFRSDEWDDFGSFVGGGAGVVLTALTFLALLYTINIQFNQLSLSRIELRLTRQEMVQNREELARSSEALNQQVNATYVQGFERTLFDSLKFLNDVVEQFEYKGPWEDNPRRGAQAFVSMHQLLADSTRLGSLGVESGDEIGDDDSLSRAFDQLRPMLGTYFRTLYNVYRYLDESRYSGKVYYNRIIRSQISDHALIILFYNSLTDRGRKFQKYIVKYNILDNISREYLINPMHFQILSTLPTAKAVNQSDED